MRFVNPKLAGFEISTIARYNQRTLVSRLRAYSQQCSPYSPRYRQLSAYLSVATTWLESDECVAAEEETVGLLQRSSPTLRRCFSGSEDIDVNARTDSSGQTNDEESHLEPTALIETCSAQNKEACDTWRR